MSKIDEQLAILQAAKEGKQIEIGLTTGWQRVADPKDNDYDFHNYTYRIKKEPDAVYIVEWYVPGRGEWEMERYMYIVANDAILRKKELHRGGVMARVRKFVGEVPPCSD